MRNIKLAHKLSQKLLITPNLRQALQLLQLPYPALKNYIEQQRAENPLLQPPNEEPLESKINQLLELSKGYSPHSQKQLIVNVNEQLQPVEKQKPQNISLQDYLLHQLGMTFLTDAELSIAYELINYIDGNGYLRIDLDKFAKGHNLSLDKTTGVLKTIQELEPSGVGARSLQECLLIQLKNKEQEDSIAYKIVQSYFKQLSRKKYDVIAKRLNINLDEAKKAVKEILSLNPRPGAVISCEENVAIKPDICVNIHNNKLQVIFNDEDLPKLRINSEHKKLLKDPDVPTEVKQFIKERLKSALWLIKAIEQREENSLKVFRAIVDIQKQAICKDLSYVKPLSLKDIATKTGLHLSTVGRIVSNKYIATPQGTIKAKDLFSSKITLGKNGEISSKSILAKIKNIILAENKQKPLTDQALSVILGDESVKISRRTIAKYRNKLRIPPSFLR